MTQTGRRGGRDARHAILVGVLTGISVALVPHLILNRARQADASITVGPEVGMPGAPPTSADGLRQRIDAMGERLRAHPADPGASVLLADALLRLARATTDPRPANRAAAVLANVLDRSPEQYDALRMLGAIALSQHRFRDALGLARRARDRRPDDAWNYGVMGDALIELGDYDEAFAAFDTMATVRPSATAYARVAYGRELRGDLTGAVEAMVMASRATSVQDPEAQAWYAAQLGELYLRMGQLSDAAHEFQRSAFLFPNYPHAMIGAAKVKAARGDRQGALTIYLEQLRRTPTLDLAWRIGDLYADAGPSADSQRYYALAEELAGPDMAQTEAQLALFLAEHNRRLPEAVTLAERVAASRHDIFTEDALAWAYYKVGRLYDAAQASQRALRTGTADERIRSHAAAIRAAMTKRTGSRTVLQEP